MTRRRDCPLPAESVLRQVALALALLMSGMQAACNGFFTEPVLTSISISPPTPTVTAGSSAQLSAVGNHDDGSTSTIGSGVSWSSSAPNIATVNSTGLVTGVASGTATISAAADAVTGSTQVTVSNGTLTAIQVTPATATLSSTLQQTQQFTATGSFQGNSDTLNVTWASSDPTLVTITSTGLASVVQGITTTQSVTITATSGSIQGSALVTVTQ